MEGSVRGVVLVGVCLALVPACPSGVRRGGQPSPQRAVTTWLAALDDGAWGRLVELAPPGLDAKKREELRRDLALRLTPYRRLDDTPFALSDPDGDGVVKAHVSLGRREGSGSVDLTLEVVEVGSKWYVRPPRLDEVPAS